MPIDVSTQSEWSAPRNSRVERALKLLKITVRRRVDGVFSGEFRSAFKGRSLEYVELREYQPGDDVRLIDWSVTARLGRPFVRVYWEHKDIHLVLLVDGSASMDMGPIGRTKRKLAQEIVALLALSAVKNRYAVGLGIYNEDLESFHPARRGLSHTEKILDHLMTCRSKAGRGCLAKTLETVSRFLRRKSVIFILSDFDGVQETPVLKRLAGLHEVVGVRIWDRREIPPQKLGLTGFRDAETGETLWIDAADVPWREKMEEEAAKEADRLKRVFHGASADFLNVETGRDYVPAFLDLFRLRAAGSRARRVMRSP